MGLLLLDGSLQKIPFDMYSATFTNTGGGTQTYLTVPSSSSLNFTTTMSMSFWIKTTDMSSFPGILGKWDAGLTQRQYFVYGTSSTVTFYVSGDGSSFVSVESATVADGNWHNVVFTYQGGTAVTAYTDGLLSNTTVVSVPASLLTSATPFSAGMNYNGGTPDLFWTGQLDDIWLFSNTLGLTDASNIYNSGTAKDNSAIGSPVSAYLFEKNGNDFLGTNPGTAVNLTYTRDVP